MNNSSPSPHLLLLKAAVNPEVKKTQVLTTTVDKTRFSRFRFDVNYKATGEAGSVAIFAASPSNDWRPVVEHYRKNEHSYFLTSNSKLQFFRRLCVNHDLCKPSWAPMMLWNPEKILHEVPEWKRICCSQILSVAVQTITSTARLLSALSSHGQIRLPLVIVSGWCSNGSKFLFKIQKAGIFKLTVKFSPQRSIVAR